MRTVEKTSEGNRRDSKATEGCGCGKGSGATSGLDFESIGRSRYLSELQQLARATLSGLPDSDALDRLNPPAQEFFEHFSELLISASAASKWDDVDIQAFAREMSWVKVVMDLQASALAKQKDDNGGDSDPDCSKAYDSCMNASGCVRDGWFCLCCIPCSLKYSRCILGLPLTGIFAA